MDDMSSRYLILTLLRCCSLIGFESGGEVGEVTLSSLE